MKKFVVAKTGEEVQFGDVLSLQRKKVTSFGVIYEKASYTLTPSNISVFIDSGIIKPMDSPKNAEDIGIYIDRLSKRLGCTSKELIAWLEKLNKTCPKAVLDILLQDIAVKFYEDNPEAFNKAESYYSLKPKDGTVGKVHVTNAYIPLFKSIEEAESARKILKEQLTFMYGKQKDC